MHRISSFKSVTFIAGALALLAFTVSAASLPSSKTVNVGGKTIGRWNLPSGPLIAGFADGLLLNRNGKVAFRMRAKLIEKPSPSLSQLKGTIDGQLEDGNPALYPMYTVSGTWTANIAGVGTFEATIARQLSPLGPVQLIGKLAGSFADNPNPSVIGKFQGEWKGTL